MDLLSQPEEVLFEIVSRLPAKVVAQFRCMNKSLLKASSGPNFPSYHSQCNSDSDSSGIFFQEPRDSIKLLCFDSATSDIFKESAQRIYKERLETLGIKINVVASRRGLVIIRRCNPDEDGCIIYLFNPLTQNPHPLELPPLPPSPSIKIHDPRQGVYFIRDFRTSGVGLTFEDAAADHYLIICLVACWIIDRGAKSQHVFYECMLYDSRVNRWRDKPRRISHKYQYGRPFQLRNLVLCNGMIHLVSDCKPIRSGEDKPPHIATLQIHSEEDQLEHFPIPGEDLVGEEHGIAIAPWGHNSLCLIRCKAKSTFIIWVTSDVRKEGSWVKIHQVDMQKIAATPQYVCTVDHFTLVDKRLLVFVVTKVGQVLPYPQEAYVFDFKGGELRYLGPHRHDGDIPILAYTSTFLQPRLRT